MKRIILLALVTLLVVGIMPVTIAAEEIAEQSTSSVGTVTLYRYREKIETTTRVPLDSPWVLISQTESMQLLWEFNNLDPEELSEKEEQYLNDCYYTKKVVDGSVVKYTTSPHGGKAYYFDNALPDYGVYDESQYTYSIHPVTGIKLYLQDVCSSYSFSVYTRYEYQYWKWSEWSEWRKTEYVASDFVEVETKESKVQYRYREKEYTTSKTALEEPWLLYNTTTEYEHNNFDTEVLSSNETIDSSICVHDKESVYKFVKPGGGSWFYATYSEYIDLLGNNPSLNSYTSYSGYYRYTYCTSKTAYSLYHYYKWSEWSEWSYTPVTASVDVEVETRIAEAFTISYDANGGVNAPESQIKMHYEDAILSLNVPTRENHEFIGWSTALDGEVEYNSGDTYSLNANVTLFAVWKNVTEYTIAYDANGGEGAPETQIKIHDVDVVLSIETPTREGYTFYAWSTDGVEENYFPGDIYKNNDSITLYAIWEIKSYIITYDANGGIDAPENQTKIHGSDVVLNSSEPSKDGFKFLGWSTTKDGSVEYYPEDVYSSNASIQLYAVWQENEPEIIASGKCGEDVNWTVMSDGILIISGTGTMNDWYSSTYTKVPWYSLRDQIKSVVIEDGVENIGGHAFYDHYSLEEVTIGSAVKDIGQWSFAQTCISEIIIPSNVEHIGPSAFNYCTKLTNVYFESSLQIESGAFNLCRNLTGVHIPSIEDLCKIEFYGIYANPLQYGDLYLNGVLTTDIVIPSSIETIPYCAFAGYENLNSVNIHSGVRHIDLYAFYNCTNLSVLYVPETIVDIEMSAFLYTSLKDVYFAACEYSWEYIQIGDNNTKLTNAKIHYDGHRPIKTDAKEATCITNGNCEYFTCEFCEILFKDETCTEKVTIDETIIPKKGHNYESYITSPTCKERGYTTHICKECGDSYIDSYTSATGHSFGDWMEIDGENHKRICDCGEVEEAEHNWDNGSVIEQATCIKTGLSLFTCTDCGATKTDTVSKLSHVYEPTITPPTCEKQGYTTYICKCGDRYIANYTIAIGHNYIGAVMVEPTCTEKGKTEYTCLGCNATYIEADVDALGHFEVTDEAVAPDCTNTGLTEGSHCSRCNEVFITQNVVEAIGHNEVIDEAVPPTYETTGLTEGSHCGRCGEILVVQEVVDMLERATYAITYDANGGTGAPRAQIKIQDINLDLSNTQPIREGHTFKGWSTSANGEVVYKSGGLYTANSSVTLYAVWETDTYTVTYNPNGGSGAPESQVKEYDIDLTISNIIPVKEGYTFIGWSTTSSGEVMYTCGDLYTTNESIVLYAVWQAKLYTVSYDANGGTGSPLEQTKKYNISLTLRRDKPTRSGYTFQGWSTSKEGSVEYATGGTYSVNKSVVLYAVWKANQYKIIYNANGGIDAPKSETKTYGVDMILSSEVPKREGYVFIGWSTSKDGEVVYRQGDTYSGNAYLVLYAVWLTDGSTKTKVTNDTTQVICDITLAGIDLNSVLIVAGYRDGMLIDKEVIIVSSTTERSTISNDIDTIKVFVLDTKKSLEPITESEIISVQN